MKYLICSLMLAACGMNLAATEKEIEISAPDGVRLCGTIQTPEASVPKGVIVLATGSGRQDRDETIFGKKPFKTIADTLAARGYATLRFDDRGAGNSGGSFESATINTDRSDMRTMLETARSLVPGVPAGVLGHSQGGLTAIGAARDSLCDFIITLAAPAWPGDSIIMSQTRAIAVAQTGRWDAEQKQRRLMDTCLSPLPAHLAKIQILLILSEDLGDSATLPQVAEQLGQIAEVMTAEPYRMMLRYNPAQDISAVHIPWLALNGSKDTQVLPGNLATISELNPSAKTVLMEGHNHLFQKASTGLLGEYASLPGDISAETLAEIVKWLDSLLSTPAWCSGMQQCTRR